MKPQPKRKEPAPWLVRAALLVLALIAYGSSFSAGLVQDSREIVSADPRIREASAENLKLILQKDYWYPKSADHLYRPVTTASMLLNYAVLGNEQRPAGYHWINFLLHAINVWLVWELAKLLLAPGWPPFLAAALWAVHPIGSESVISVVGRADLLAAMAVLGGLLLYTRDKSPRAAVALFFISTLGVFSKENAAVLLPLMLLWDLTFGIGERRNGIARRWSAYAAVAASLVVMWAARQYVFSNMPWPQTVYVDNILRVTDFWTARFTAVKALGLALWLMVFPLSLSSDRSFNEIRLAAWSDPGACLSLAVIAGIVALAVVRRRREPVLFFLAGFAAVCLLPTSNLVVRIGSIFGERFLYLPSVAVCLAATALLWRLRKQRGALYALAAVIVLFAARTYARGNDWHDDVSLAAADVVAAPGSFRLHDMFAKSLFDLDGRRFIDKVIQEGEIAWAILQPLRPEHSTELVPTHLGLYYAAKAGFPGEPHSRELYEKSLAVLLKAREISRASEKAYDEAQRAHGKPLETRAAFQLLYFSLANTYLHLGRYPEALEALQYGRDINPRVPEGYDGLAIAYVGMGRQEEGVLALLQKAHLNGFNQQTLTTLRDLYSKIPEGWCAIVPQGPVLATNMDCPIFRRHLCQAAADLARSYRAARMPREAAETQAAAARQYGCAP